MDMSKEQIKQLICELGSVAELCCIYHQQLLKQNFTRSEALALTKELQTNLLFNHKNKEDK